jgi:hypothetical protein
MKYSDYITLGFKRVDISDAVEYNHTGNEAYVLEYKVNKRLLVCAHVGSEPRLYYKHNFMCNLTMDQVQSIINQSKYLP